MKRTKLTQESGFTLVELLVVILIIGILAAIAIPVFLNQRQIANDAAVKSDVKNISLAIETYFVDNKNASTINKTEVMNMVHKSQGVKIIFSGTRNDWCINGSHPNGKIYRNWDNNPLPNIRPYALYSSKNGGMLQDETHLSTMSCYVNSVDL